MTQHHLIETSPCLSTVGSGKWKFRKLKYPKCLWQRLREELILSYFYPRERRSSQKVVETPEDWVASRSSCLLPPRERPRTAVWRRGGRWSKWWWWWGGGGVGWDRGGGVSVFISPFLLCHHYCIQKQLSVGFVEHLVRLDRAEELLRVQKPIDIGVHWLKHPGEGQILQVNVLIM